MTFGNRLKQLREEKGLTQFELAQMINVGRPTIAGYETRSKEPDFEKIIWFCKYFNVSADYILGISDTKNNEIKSDPITHGLNYENIEELKKYADLLRLKQRAYYEDRIPLTKVAEDNSYNGLK